MVDKWNLSQWLYQEIVLRPPCFFVFFLWCVHTVCLHHVSSCCVCLCTKQACTLFVISFASVFGPSLFCSAAEADALAISRELLWHYRWLTLAVRGEWRWRIEKERKKEGWGCSFSFHLSLSLSVRTRAPSGPLEPQRLTYLPLHLYL